MNFNEFLNLNEAKSFKVGDTWEWHGKDWDPKAKKDVDMVKKVTITKIDGSNVTGQFDGESKEYIIRDASKYLKKKVNESEELDEAGTVWSKWGKSEPMGLSKAETKKVAELYATAISKKDGVKCTVNQKSLSEDSFDLDIDGEEWAGGSYNIYDDGQVVNMAVKSGISYGKYNDSVDTIVKNLKSLKESLEVNEAKITLKRQYTENHPAATVGKHAAIRNKIIEALREGELTKEEFDQLVSGLTEDSKRWLKRNAQFFNIGEEKIVLSSTGKKILKSIDEAGYRPMTDAERQKKQYKEQQLKRLRAVDKKEEEGKRLRALQQKLHQQRTRKANETFVHETFESFVENELNEKVYQMTGSYGAKGIPGKVLFAFKKEIEKIKFEGNADSTLEEINKAWVKWANKEAAILIFDEVMKVVKDKGAIVYITASLGDKWEADTVNGLNKPGKAELFVRIPYDFVINVGFADDVDANKFSKKLGGMTNSAVRLNYDVDVFGSYQNVGGNNTEIRETLLLSIDAK